MKFLMKGVEALGENGRPEEHDGLSSVLREASASPLHPRTDDGLRGSLSVSHPPMTSCSADGRFATRGG